jgi:hypothetical protein
VRTAVESLSPDRWPARNTFFALTAATWTDPAPLSPPAVRTVVLNPAAFDGKALTLRGRFRAQNLYGDLPAWPRQSQWDFVLQAADAAIWVTGLRPRGGGLDLDPTTRRGAGTWLEAKGIIRFENGLARLEASAVAPSTPDAVEPAPVAAPPPSLPPPAVIFSMPLDGESEIDPATAVRVQFSRDMRDSSFGGAVKVAYSSDVAEAVPPFAVKYLPDNRAIEIRFKTPLASAAAVTVSLGPPAVARDGAPLTPASFTFRTKPRQPPLDRLTHLPGHNIAIVERAAGGLNRRQEFDRDRCRPDDPAALSHGISAARNRHWHDRCLRLDCHHDAALLERQQLAGAASRALGEDEERRA